MSDTLVTVVAIGLVAILMFVFPVMTMADRANTVSRTDVETMTSEFINEIKTTGKLTKDRYGKFLENLTSTGNKYHEEECIFVKDKTNTRRLTIEEFESGDYEPCDICLPHDSQ